MKNKIVKIGITGNIGSGKSKVCHYLDTKYGIPVYSSDDRAKLLMVSNKKLKSSIISNFGENCYFENGELNKTHISSIIFNDPKKLEIINGLVHPIVKEDFINWTNTLAENSDKIKFVLYESALLSDKPDYLDFICFIESKYDIRLNRILKRNPILSEEEVKSRMDSQKNTNYHNIKNNFDYFLVNNSDDEIILRSSASTLYDDIIQDIKKLNNLSRYLVKLLRHSPEKENLAMDDNGWVSVEEIVQKLKITKKELDFIVFNNNKNRFSYNVDFTKIRASQGHSIDIDIDLVNITPPEFLYHGTSIQNFEKIKNSGILKMNRTHVHLTEDMETAKKVALRKGKDFKILRINSKDMHDNGIKFYKSDNGVWLTDYIDPKYIKN